MRFLGRLVRWVFRALIWNVTREVVRAVFRGAR